MRTRILTASAALATVATLAIVATTGSQAATTKVVRVEDFRFSPSSVTVRAGTTVKWVWAGKADHDVEVTKGPRDFHSRVMTKGSYAKRFTRKGTYRIDCSIHASIMRMTVRVR
jgi:plastocyanin